jgi:hypothetical protein
VAPSLFRRSSPPTPHSPESKLQQPLGRKICDGEGFEGDRVRTRQARERISTPRHFEEIAQAQGLTHDSGGSRPTAREQPATVQVLGGFDVDLQRSCAARSDSRALRLRARLFRGEEINLLQQTARATTTARKSTTDSTEPVAHLPAYAHPRDRLYWEPAYPVRRSHRVAFCAHSMGLTTRVKVPLRKKTERRTKSKLTLRDSQA